MKPKEIRALRIRLGLYQRELAGLLGVSDRTVQGWENGRKPTGPAVNLMREMLERHGGAKPLHSIPAR